MQQGLDVRPVAPGPQVGTASQLPRLFRSIDQACGQSPARAPQSPIIGGELLPHCAAPTPWTPRPLLGFRASWAAEQRLACQLTFPEAQPRPPRAGLHTKPARPSRPTCDSSTHPGHRAIRRPPGCQRERQTSWKCLLRAQSRAGTIFSRIEDSRRAALGCSASAAHSALTSACTLEPGGRGFSSRGVSAPPRPSLEQTALQCHADDPAKEPPAQHSRGSSHPRGTQRDHGVAEPSRGWKLESLGERLLER